MEKFREKTKYSIVIPVYNEEESLPLLVTRLQGIMDKLDGPAEVVLVDDGSADLSFKRAKDAREADPRFKLIRFSRNFGHQLAITAGMDATSGDAVIVMDADLQDPPEIIVDMIAKWREGYEVVYARRARREGERLFKTATAAAFYGLLHRISETDTQVDVGDFRLVDRKALNAFLAMRENNRYVRGMFSWIGFRQTDVSYVRDARHAGETHYTMRKMLKLASNGILGFSTAPLRLALGTGMFLAAISVLYGLAAIALKLAAVPLVPGYASLLVAVTFLAGIQLMVLGVTGLYIGRIYDEVRGRPLYIVRESYGFADEGEDGWQAFDQRTGNDRLAVPFR
ncbi:MAG TPA: glycosyltransferase family 2 protein [Trebonia sp.]|jgi:dolichol-phosphate mannosyltransferase